MRFAKRVEHFAPTGAFEFLARAKELETKGKSIIHLEIGEPDFGTPDNIKESAIRSLREGFTKYVLGQGIQELREAIAERVANTRNISVHPDQVVVAAGASSLIFFVLVTLIEQGDEVIYADPGFFTYEPVTIFAGGIPKSVHLIEENGFSVDIDEFKAKLVLKW